MKKNLMLLNERKWLVGNYHCIVKCFVKNQDNFLYTMNHSTVENGDLFMQTKASTATRVFLQNKVHCSTYYDISIFQQVIENLEITHSPRSNSTHIYEKPTLFPNRYIE